MPIEMKHNRHAVLAILLFAWILSSIVTPASAVQPKSESHLQLSQRQRVKQGDLYSVQTKQTLWNPKETAIVVCDMWNYHHSINATNRVGEMAPRINRVLEKARAMGVLIIHAPSSCMAFYKDHPARKRAQAAPKASNLPAGIGGWCSWLSNEEKAAYPIDQSDGGIDDDPKARAEWHAKLKKMGHRPGSPWTRQIDTLEIDEDRDVITDNGVENWNVQEQHGIKNVIVLGVHTNMCVLGRPFGLRQMAKNGRNVVLMRDLTDTMYNPAKRPFVSHFKGTDLIVEHIEKFVCPTVTSDDLLADGQEFRFKGRAATDWEFPKDKENFHVFLLMGQSNMSGGRPVYEDLPHLFFIPQQEKDWVPAKKGKLRSYALGVEFAKAYMKQHPGVSVGLIPAAKGGSQIAGLHKGSTFYAIAMEKAAKARKQGVIKGVLWHQGESDTVFPHLAKAYAERLKQLVHDIRSDLKDDSLPFVAGNLGEFYGTGKYHIKNVPSIKLVRKALRALPIKLPHTGFAESTGCAHRGDFVHFEAKAHVQFGQRYFAAYESATNQRKHLVVIAAAPEYKTIVTLPKFSEKCLSNDFRVSYVKADPKNGNVLIGLDAIKTADVILVSVHRRALPKQQLDAIRKFIAAGNPVVGIRTASHAFTVHSEKVPAGHDRWPEFDRDVLGGNYVGHHGNKSDQGPFTLIQVTADAASHPILTGILKKEFKVRSWLYKVSPLGAKTKVLMTGRVGDRKPHEPVAWTNTNKYGGKVFYTSLGHQDDFEMPAFQQLLTNGIYWAVGLSVPREHAVSHPLTTATEKRPIRQPVKPASKSLEELRTGWSTIKVPGVWDGQLQGALDNYNGVAWYRCQVDVPADWKGKKIAMAISHVDNCHEAYINGVKVGSQGAFPPQFRNGLTTDGQYVISADVIRPGKRNVIAVRIYDHDGRGGFKGAAPVLFTSSKQITTTGAWQIRVGDNVAWSKETEFDTPKVFDRVETSKLQIGPQSKFELKSSANVPSLTIPDDLELDLLMKEPLVANPLYFNFDERGRMWLVQYRQYPMPAGLKLVSRDKVWRNIYDPPFAPPPPHAVDSPFHGKDRITIHEDTNGDGTYDKHKVFLDGLNFCSAAIKGRGGVYVLNPPYLLFYADKNNDDVPDVPKPRILLSGFGFEDSHSFANNLRWGPDGWLYATQGSTVSASVVRHGADGKPLKGEMPVHTMGQNIWRYHPERHTYEVFAEGGGNAFGVEFDSGGHVYSGHNGGNTRGFHYVQGGYYQKTFGKHGSLSNPYAFTHLPYMTHQKVQRFTHTFEIYESTELPSRYHGKLIGVDPHMHYVIHSSIFADGSSRQTRDVAKLVVPGKSKQANWFSPVDIQTGPDGALYLADWYSVQTNHYRNHQGQTNPDLGRVYRLRAKKHEYANTFNLSKESSGTLVEKYLSHPNRWYRETALRLLGDRKDPSIVPLLKRTIINTKGQLALESLWALHLSGGLDDAFAKQTLVHVDPKVRRWTVRLLGDRPTAPTELTVDLLNLARSEPNVEVRSQLASTARRLPAQQGLAIVAVLLARGEDDKDIHIPSLLWWAVEAHADSHDTVLSQLDNDAWWKAKTRVAGASMPACLMRRWAMRGRPQDLVACGKLLSRAPKTNQSELARRFITAFEGRQIPRLPDELAEALADVGGVYATLLGVRRGDEPSVRKALGSIAKLDGSETEQVQLIQAIGDVRSLPNQSVPALLSAVAKGSLRVKNAAMIALQNFDDPQVAKGLIGLYQQLPKDAQITAQASLASRATWAVALLQAIDRKQIETRTIEQDAIVRLRLHRSDKLAPLVAKHFPDNSTSEEILNNRIKALATIVRGGAGVPKRGEALFYKKANCAKCHTIYDKGGDIGPDLTTYNRGNIEHMLLSVVNPSAEVREGYDSFTVVTDDGQVLSGFKINENDKTLVIRGIDGQNKTIAKDNIDEIVPSTKSLMPDGLLDQLSDQELRDLFAFLSSTTPPY